ncbi:MAG: MGDG synthase family glycosyltransferase [Verrucomicrobiales bacterium]
MDSFEKDNFVSVLTASFGDGHNTAAQNIVTALNDLKIPNSGALDLLNTIHPSIMQCLTKGYRIITTRYPSIWKQLYRIADNISFGDESFDLMPTVTRGTAAYLQKTKPKTVISTYPLYGNLIERIFGSQPLPFKLITMVTDSKSINRAWLNKTSGNFLVLDQISADFFLENGIPEKRIHITGFPVSPLFENYSSNPMERKTPTQFKILYTPSAKTKHVKKTLKALHKIKKDSAYNISLTIVLGRHAQRLRSSVNTEADNETRIIEWTNNMPELLNKHHLVIGKAGGASVQEALASSCPMIIDSMIPGQEEGNAELIANYGAGLITTNPENLEVTIQNILKENGAKWLSMRKAAKKNGHVKTAHKVAKIATL